MTSHHSQGDKKPPVHRQENKDNGTVSLRIELDVDAGLTRALAASINHHGDRLYVLDPDGRRRSFDVSKVSRFLHGLASASARSGDGTVTLVADANPRRVAEHESRFVEPDSRGLSELLEDGSAPSEDSRCGAGVERALYGDDVVFDLDEVEDQGDGFSFPRNGFRYEVRDHDGEVLARFASPVSAKLCAQGLNERGTQCASYSVLLQRMDQTDLGF